MLKPWILAGAAVALLCSPAAALTKAQCEALRWQYTADIEFQMKAVELAQKLNAQDARFTLLLEFTNAKETMEGAPPGVAAALAGLRADLKETIEVLIAGPDMPQSAQTAALYALVEVCPP